MFCPHQQVLNDLIWFVSIFVYIEYIFKIQLPSYNKKLYNGLMVSVFLYKDWLHLRKTIAFLLKCGFNKHVLVTLIYEKLCLFQSFLCRIVLFYSGVYMLYFKEEDQNLNSYILTKHNHLVRRRLAGAKSVQPQPISLDSGISQKSSLYIQLQDFGFRVIGNADCNKWDYISDQID